MFTFAREIISEVDVFDKMDFEMPASVKIEQSEVDLDYPGVDTSKFNIHENCMLLQIFLVS